MKAGSLFVRVNVSRDVISQAEMFQNERLAIWEYVANSLQYVDPGTVPTVKVRLDSKRKRIAIEDNGRGMRWGGADGLEGFFKMHAENVDRKRGRPGRGRFGTGKAAAFGIADVLRITTARNGRRSKVELSRADLDAAAESGKEIPVQEIEREVPTAQPNGTLVEIERVRLPRTLDQAGVISFIERHLAHYPKTVTVIVNNHQCEVVEPPVERVESVPATGNALRVLGPVTLTIKISKSPLEEDLRGVSIFSNEVWHETTLLTSKGREMSEYLFGEIDVAALDADRSTPAAFDVSRHQRLNPDNPVVRAIYEFVAPEIERLRRELVEQQRQHRETEEAKRLEREASQIERIINEDFETFRRRIQKVHAAGKIGFDAGDTPAVSTTPTPDGVDDFLYGGHENAKIIGNEDFGGPGTEPQPGPPNPSPPGPPPRLNPLVEPDAKGVDQGHRQRRNRQPGTIGGFHVAFEHLGEPNARAQYVAERRTIIINLDFPQVAIALKGRAVDDPVFRRLAYEVAFAEYAVAVASELNNRNEFLEPSDAIVEIRERLNAVARRAAPLYAE
jgi:hypothetical protein